MKKPVLIAAVTALAASASPAFAQDADWSGPYVGAYVEAAYDEAGFEDFSCWAACTKPTLQGTAAKAGATLGFNLEIDETLVFGLAGDFGSGAKRSLVPGAAIGISAVPTYNLESDVEYEASLRARAGLVVGNTLVYVTGGAGFAKSRYSVVARNITVYNPQQTPNFEANWEGTVSGPVFGGGIEHRFGATSARIEVLHRRYGPESTCYANSEGPATGQCWPTFYAIPAQVSIDQQSTALRFGLSYRF